MSTKIIVRMNRIPELYKNDILGLKGITRMVMLHKSGSSFSVSTEEFVRAYIPAVKYRNKNFDFRRIREDQYEMPQIQLYDKELKLRETLETGNLSSQQILEKIKLIDQKLASY